MRAPLRLISHHLCPYVQRAVIALHEKAVDFERIDVDLANKPAWFTDLTPLGKTPLLLVGDQAIFESAVILEYLEETRPPALHPRDALERASHRAWIEFASAVLASIAGLYSAPDKTPFEARRATLAGQFADLERVLGAGPYFAGIEFSLVEAAFGPVFRYFDVFERVVDLAIFDRSPKVRVWRAALSRHPSIRDAVCDDYETRLRDFLLARKSHMTSLMPSTPGHQGKGRRPQPMYHQRPFRRAGPDE